MLKAIIFHMDGIIDKQETSIPYLREFIGNIHSSGCLLEILPPLPLKEVQDFLEAARQLCILPSECMVISDSDHGLCTAKAAGMARIGYHNAALPNQGLHGADYVIEGFDEIDLHFIQQVYQHSKGEPATIGETKRLLLRELDMTDIPRMHQIASLAEVIQYTGDSLRPLKEELELHKAYIKNAYHFFGYGFWGVFLQSDGRLIGRCGIQNCEIDGKTEIELGYLLDPAYQGAGYATESARFALDYAMGRLAIRRVVSVISCSNFRSLQLAKRLGMHCEKMLCHKNTDCFLYVAETASQHSSDYV